MAHGYSGTRTYAKGHLAQVRGAQPGSGGPYRQWRPLAPPDWAREETARGAICHSRRRPVSPRVPHFKRTGPLRYGPGGGLEKLGFGPACAAVSYGASMGRLGVADRGWSRMIRSTAGAWLGMCSRLLPASLFGLGRTVRPGPNCSALDSRCSPLSVTREQLPTLPDRPARARLVADFLGRLAATSPRLRLPRNESGPSLASPRSFPKHEQQPAAGGLLGPGSLAAVAAVIAAARLDKRSMSVAPGRVPGSKRAAAGLARPAPPRPSHRVAAGQPSGDSCF